MFMSPCYIRVARQGPLQTYLAMAATATSTGCTFWTTACAWLISPWLCESGLTSHFLKADSMTVSHFLYYSEHLLLFCSLSWGRHWDAALYLFTIICLCCTFLARAANRASLVRCHINTSQSASFFAERNSWFGRWHDASLNFFPEFCSPQIWVYSWFYFLYIFYNV